MGIMGRDTGMSMPMGITCVAAGCSAAGIGRPSAGIGRVISGEIGGNGHPHDGNEAYTRLLHAGGGIQVWALIPTAKN